MWKKTRLYAGIAMLVQAFAFAVLFCTQIVKRKSLAGAFLAVAAAEGAAGGFLLWRAYEENRRERALGYTEDDAFYFDEDEMNRELSGNPDEDAG